MDRQLVTEKEREQLWQAHKALDTWLQADELRFVEILAGESLRWCVRLKVIDFTLAGETTLGQAECGTLAGAIQEAIEDL
jgi:hypothetical protein